MVWISLGYGVVDESLDIWVVGGGVQSANVHRPASQPAGQSYMEGYMSDVGDKRTGVGLGDNIHGIVLLLKLLFTLA